MAGNYRNKHKFEYATTEDWLQHAVDVQKSENYPACHFTDIEELRRTMLEGTLNGCVEAFLKFVELAQEYQVVKEYCPMMVVPLGYCEELVPWSLDKVRNITKLHDDEPPSLYLISRELDKLYKSVEEYIFPVPITVIGISDLQIVCYYRCHRELESIQQGWEFCEGLYFKYFPRQLIV